jgi:hypothetical protein
MGIKTAAFAFGVRLPIARSFVVGTLETEVTEFVSSGAIWANKVVGLVVTKTVARRTKLVLLNEPAI